MNTFLKEATEWLAEFGYTLDTYNTDGKRCVFKHTQKYSKYPVITCKEIGSTRACTLEYHGLELFVVIKVGPIMFKTPSIGDYIGIMLKYAVLCSQKEPVAGVTVEKHSPGISEVDKFMARLDGPKRFEEIVLVPTPIPSLPTEDDCNDLL